MDGELCRGLAESSEEEEMIVSDKSQKTTSTSEMTKVPPTSDLNSAADTGGEPKGKPAAYFLIQSYRRHKKWLQLDYSNAKKQDPSPLPEP